MPAVVEDLTPTTSPQAAAMESSADKKRNKLGYHRTSVACVHCRRRKIRCLVAPDDSQGRCENCIRLRKECQFFPVDQQPPVEKKSRPSSRLDTASTDPSTASSSPPNVSGVDQAEAFFPYQPMPLGSSQDVAGFNPAAFPGNPMAPFAPGWWPPQRPGTNVRVLTQDPVDRTVGSAEFASPPALDPSVPWDEYTTMAADPQMLANMSAGKTMMNMPWGPAHNPMAPMPTASPLPGTPTVPSQPQGLTPAPTFAMQPDGTVWQVPPTRTMSFPAPAADMVPYPAPGQFVQPSPADLKRRMTSPAQSFSGAPVNPQSPPAADLQTGISVSYPGQPTPMGFHSWQDVNTMSPMNVVPYPIYPDPGQQAGFGSQSPMGPPGPGHSPHS
ncbi:C6 finger domain protein [Aspergillus heteromorphus CBS 117.55]|uniref:C6 finger domain protein n=1 Tax=Aspergillus heteromorphus CBS 117.55 TaxID=1448321 RepID=A0A317WEW7_9EURO|nr:C6 finger domain protein [Aspergillus heteromorphus CBS 117.55]PWY83548.1 C6 finger domain protein [Aspergillus heteromorphus CBS 117.55]